MEKERFLSIEVLLFGTTKLSIVLYYKTLKFLSYCIFLGVLTIGYHTFFNREIFYLTALLFPPFFGVILRRLLRPNEIERLIGNVKNSSIDCVNPVRFKRHYIANDASIKRMGFIRLLYSFLNESVVKQKFALDVYLLAAA